jgi:hypothetical protein
MWYVTKLIRGHQTSEVIKPSAWGYIWATQFMGEINTRNLVFQVGGLSKIERVKYGHKSRGIQARERLRWRCPPTTGNYRSDFSSEREPHINKPVTVYKNFKKMRKKLVASPRRVPDTKADWLTDSRS